VQARCVHRRRPGQDLGQGQALAPAAAQLHQGADDPPTGPRAVTKWSRPRSWVSRCRSPGPEPWARSAARTRRGAASPGRRRSAGRASGSDQVEPAAVLGVAVPFTRARTLGQVSRSNPPRRSFTRAPTIRRQDLGQSPGGAGRGPGWSGPGRQGQGLGRFTRCKSVACIGADRARTLGRVRRSNPPRCSSTTAPTIRRQGLNGCILGGAVRVARARALGQVSRSHPPRCSFTRAPTIRRQDLGQ